MSILEDLRATLRNPFGEIDESKNRRCGTKRNLGSLDRVESDESTKKRGRYKVQENLTSLQKWIGKQNTDEKKVDENLKNKENFELQNDDTNRENDLMPSEIPLPPLEEETQEMFIPLNPLELGLPFSQEYASRVRI